VLDFFSVSFSRAKTQEKTTPEIEQTTQETNREMILKLFEISGQDIFYTVFLRLFISKTLLHPNGQFKQRK
jgi:hypothetical protein